MPVAMLAHPIPPYIRPKNQPGTSSTSSAIAIHREPQGWGERPPTPDEHSQDEPCPDEHEDDHPPCIGISPPF